MVSNFSAMKEQIISEIEKLKGNCGVIVKNVNTGEYFGYNEEGVFPSASIIKLSILLELFKRIEKGETSLEDRVAIKNEDKVGGFGILKDLDSNLNVTMKDLATLMIVLSDNVATNILIDILGMNSINNTVKELGMKDTVLGRKMMDGQAKKRGLDNYTSPKDTLRILEYYVDSSSIVSSNDQNTIMDILKKQQCNNKLPLLMPKETIFAHKTGDLPGIEHDAGILFSKVGEIIIVVLTKDLEDNDQGVKFNNNIGKIVAEYSL